MSRERTFVTSDLSQITKLCSLRNCQSGSKLNRFPNCPPAMLSNVMVSTFFSGNKRTVTHCQRVCQRLALQHTLAMSKYDKYKKIHLKNNPRTNHVDENLIPLQEFSSGFSTGQSETSGGPDRSWQWAR